MPAFQFRPVAMICERRMSAKELLPQSTVKLIPLLAFLGEPRLLLEEINPFNIVQLIPLVTSVGELRMPGKKHCPVLSGQRIPPAHASVLDMLRQQRHPVGPFKAVPTRKPSASPWRQRQQSLPQHLVIHGYFLACLHWLVYRTPTYSNTRANA